jgi:hypothetical protein
MALNTGEERGANSVGNEFLGRYLNLWFNTTLQSMVCPGEFYVDYGSIFSVNTNNQNRDEITQCERDMKEFGVTIIHARSSQVKGRIERCSEVPLTRSVVLYLDITFV